MKHAPTEKVAMAAKTRSYGLNFELHARFTENTKGVAEI